MEIKYKGVQKRRLSGRAFFTCKFNHNGTSYRFGYYKTAKEAAKAHDLFVIKKGIDRETNFLKRKLV